MKRGELSDRVTVEPSGFGRPVRVEPEQALRVLIPVLQQRVELINGLPHLAVSVAIVWHRSGETVQALLAKQFDLRLSRMRAQRLAGDMGELVPHHDGLLATDLVVLVLDRHAPNSRRELIDHAIECIVVIGLAIGNELVFDLGG